MTTVTISCHRTRTPAPRDPEGHLKAAVWGHGSEGLQEERERGEEAQHLSVFRLRVAPGQAEPRNPGASPPRRRLPAAAGSRWRQPRRAAARSRNRPPASSGARLDSHSPWASAADALRPHEVGQDPKHRQVEDLGRGGGGGLPPLLLAQRP